MPQIVIHLLIYAPIQYIQYLYWDMNSVMNAVLYRSTERPSTLRNKVTMFCLEWPLVLTERVSTECLAAASVVQRSTIKSRGPLLSCHTLSHPTSSLSFALSFSALIKLNKNKLCCALGLVNVRSLFKSYWKICFSSTPLQRLTIFEHPIYNAMYSWQHTCIR